MDEAFRGIDASDLSIALEVSLPFSELILRRVKSVETRVYPIAQCLIGVKILLLQSQENTSLQSSLGNLIPSSADGTHDGLVVIGSIVVSECYQYRDWNHWDSEREQHQVPKDSKFEMKEGDREDCAPRWAWKIAEAVPLHDFARPALSRVYRSVFRIY